MWQRKVEIPNVEFHELSDATVQTRRLSQSSIRYLISDRALDNLCVLRGRASGGSNRAAVTLSAVEGDRTTSTGRMSLGDIPCKERLERVSSWTYRRKFCSSKYGTKWKALKEIFSSSAAFYCTVGTKIFPVRPNEWASDTFVNIKWNVFCCGCYNNELLRFVTMMITVGSHCRLLATECWGRERRILVK
jgi:hypothetical protein